MQDFDTQAELIKLSRVLGAGQAEIAFLAAVDAADLRVLRQAMSHSLFDEGRKVFHNMARAAKLLPHKLLVRTATRVYGSVLCARVASEMEPGRAIHLAADLPPDFLADVSIALDPEHTRDIIRGIPPARVIEVAHILLSREEHITMARFVDALSDEVLAETLDSIDDDAALMHIGFFVEDKEHLNKAIVHLNDERLANMVMVCEEHGLWPEILALIEHMDEPTRKRIADVAGRQDEKVLLSLLAEIRKRDIWPAVMDMIEAMSEAGFSRIANLAAKQDDDTLISLLQVAGEHARWPLVLKMLAAMDARHQQHMAQLAWRIGEDPEQRWRMAERMGLIDDLKPFLETYEEA